MARNKHAVQIFLVGKKWWTAVSCLCLAAVMFFLVNYPAAVGASASARQLPIYCVQRDQKIVSISFDAAWGNEDTQQLIDILNQYKVKATFFVVGAWVDKYPESVKALHDAGHEVMNHSNTHAHYPQMSVNEVVADLNACNDKIEAVTGVRPTLVRLPYGDYDNNSINAVRSIGMEPIQWDVEPLHRIGVIEKRTVPQQIAHEKPPACRVHTHGWTAPSQCLIARQKIRTAPPWEFGPDFYWDRITAAPSPGPGR